MKATCILFFSLLRGSFSEVFDDCIFEDNDADSTYYNLTTLRSSDGNGYTLTNDFNQSLNFRIDFCANLIQTCTHQNYSAAIQQRNGKTDECEGSYGSWSERIKHFPLEDPAGGQDGMSLVFENGLISGCEDGVQTQVNILCSDMVARQLTGSISKLKEECHYLVEFFALEGCFLTAEKNSAFPSFLIGLLVVVGVFICGLVFIWITKKRYSEFENQRTYEYHSLSEKGKSRGRTDDFEKYSHLYMDTTPKQSIISQSSRTTNKSMLTGRSKSAMVQSSRSMTPIPVHKHVKPQKKYRPAYVPPSGRALQ